VNRRDTASPMAVSNSFITGKFETMLMGQGGVSSSVLMLLPSINYRGLRQLRPQRKTHSRIYIAPSLRPSGGTSGAKGGPGHGCRAARRGAEWGRLGRGAALLLLFALERQDCQKLELHEAILDTAHAGIQERRGHDDSPRLM